MTPLSSGDERIPEPSHTSVWAPDGSGTIELDRLCGPVTGQVRPPAHLLEGSGIGGEEWDIADPDVKIRLYEVCLTRGGVFDIYGYVNLRELARLWPVLRLPRRISPAWTAALRQAGLLGPAVPAPTPITARRGAPAA